MKNIGIERTISNPNDRSRLLYERAVEVMPGGNTRTTVFFKPYPIYAAFGHGCRVTDVDGVTRIDTVNNFTSLIHGHANGHIEKAAVAQLRKGTSVGMPTESEIILAEELCARVKSIDQIRFMNSGTEAVMTAIKAARAFTGRARIAKCEGAYHGSYDLAEVGQDSTPGNWGNRARPHPVPTSVGTPKSVLDEVVVLPFNDLDSAAALIRENAGDLAAILVDPMPNRAGLVPADRGYLAGLRELATSVGAVLIFDEVISFRLAYDGAQSVFGITPDLTALGKIIGGGFPIGAVGGRRDIMSVFDPAAGKPLVPHGGTFSANPMSMVAGFAALELLGPSAFVRLDSLGDQLQAGLEEVFGHSGIAGQVTGRGSLRRVHLTSGPITDYRSAFPTDDSRKQFSQLQKALLDAGVLLSPNGLIALSTAMSEDDIDEICDAFASSLRFVQ